MLLFNYYLILYIYLIILILFNLINIKMSRQEFSDPDISLILEISGNNQCFDCMSKNPRFSSVNNGVLLCGICARAHQYYNNNVSRIKSLEADLWSKEEVKYLRLGGNARFKNLLEEYEIPNDLDNQDYKYHTKIAEYYRTLLGQETRNRLCLLKRPNLLEGKETIEKVPNNQNELNNNNIKNNFNEKKNEINNNIINNDDDNYVFGLKNNKENKQSEASIKLNQMIDSIGSFFNRVGEKINEKSKEYDINGKINNIKNSDTYKSISEKFDKGINIIQKKTNEFINDINSTSEYEFYAQQEINNQLNSQPNNYPINNNFQSNYSNISSQSYNNKNIIYNNNNQFNSYSNNNNLNNIDNNNNINNNYPIQKNINNINSNNTENNINNDNNYKIMNENINDINALNINENDSINKKEENNNFDINHKNEEKLD